MADQSVVGSVRRYLRSLLESGVEVQAGVLFGSWARDNADRWSDIDVFVVSRRFDGRIDRRDIDLLWRLAARVDSRIEPVPCGERQWREDRSSPLLEVARREGQRISLEDEPAPIANPTE